MKGGLKAIANLSMEKRILIPYENNHYITLDKKNCFFLNVCFSFYHNISVFISLQRSNASSFNGVLFEREISKELLILLYMDYDIALRLEMLKVKSNK